MTLSMDSQRRLIWHGMFLFLLGLLISLAEGQVENPRMGLAAHLEGLMNGTFVIALGAVWPFVKLSSMLTALTFRAVLYGTYANLFVTTLAAVLGANAMSPITGGQGAPAWQEAFITGGFVTVGIAMVVFIGADLMGIAAERWIASHYGTGQLPGFQLTGRQCVVCSISRFQRGDLLYWP